MPAWSLAGMARMISLGVLASGLAFGAAGMGLEFLVIDTLADNTRQIHEGVPSETRDVSGWISTATSLNRASASLLALGTFVLLAVLAATWSERSPRERLWMVALPLGCFMVGAQVKTALGEPGFSQSWQMTAFPLILLLAGLLAFQVRGAWRVMLGAGAAAVVAGVVHASFRTPYATAPPGYLPDDGVKAAWTAVALLLMMGALVASMLRSGAVAFSRPGVAEAPAPREA